MEECNDNRSMDNSDCKTTPSPKLKPKKRSLVERELETSLTSKITSPISNSKTINKSRYGRARRIKNDYDRKIESPLPTHNKEISPNRGLTAYKMYASNSPTKPQSINYGFDNQIENIYNQNIALSRFSSEDKAEKLSNSKIYMRKDLIQTRDKEETIVLIKNMFSPNKNVPKADVTLSSDKSSKNHKRNLSSVVKTLDFDGKKKKEGPEKRVSQSVLFEQEAQSEYQVGDLAWARMGSYPFWPSIVTREPSSNLFIKKKLFGKLEKDIVHVTFLGDNGRRGWILVSMLRKYLGREEFETARENFTSEAKRKDYRLYAAFFVTGKRLPLWHLSIEEADILLKEPKRLRIDILNSMLTKGNEHKNIPAKSKKVTRTDSDISLSESLYDSLFSEEDHKGSDTETCRSKIRKSFDVSEVVTACLDNMAAKTGITKIQKQSHMDIWLQKAKSKTPEKCQFKQSKCEKKIKVILKSCNESHASLEYKQNHEREHDYFTRSANTNGYYDNENVSEKEFDDQTNTTINLSNNESDSTTELCTNICKKDVLGISPDILDENFTEIEVITNEDMIVDQCDIKDMIFKVENSENVELPLGDNKPILKQSHCRNEFTEIYTINDNKDSIMEPTNENHIDEHKGEGYNTIEPIRSISSSEKNLVTNTANIELFSNNVEVDLPKTGDVNQNKYQLPVSVEKSLIVSGEDQADSNLSELDCTNTDSTNVKSCNIVQNNILCKDYGAELELLGSDKEINTNHERNIKKTNEGLKKKVECIKESVDCIVIDRKEHITSENNNLDKNMEKCEANKNSIEWAGVTETSNQLDYFQFFNEDSCNIKLIYESSDSDSITTTFDKNVTDIKCGSTVVPKINLSLNSEVVQENSDTINFALSYTPKVCNDVSLYLEQDSQAIHLKEDITKSLSQHGNLKLRDQDSSDFKFTNDLDIKYNCDNSNILDSITLTTSEKDGFSCEYKNKKLPFVESECNENQNKQCDVDQSKLSDAICPTNNISENNCQDFEDFTKSKKETKDHSTSQENGFMNAQFLKYVEEKQDIILDENPDLTYEEVTAYLLKTWHYEQSSKSGKKGSSILEVTTADKNDHHSIESKNKNKSSGKKDKYLQTSIAFNKLQNNTKKVCLQNKPKIDNENSNLPNELAKRNNPKQCDSSKKDEVGASLPPNQKNNRDLLPHNNLNIGNEQTHKEEKNMMTTKTFQQLICDSKKDVIKNSNKLEKESFDKKKDAIQIREPSTPIILAQESDFDVRSNEKEYPNCFLNKEKNMDSEHASEESIINKCKENNSKDKIELTALSQLKNITVVNDLSYVSGTVAINNDDTGKIENTAHSDLNKSEKLNENNVSKKSLSLRLKRNVVMSDTDSDSAKSSTSIKKNDKSMTSPDNGLTNICKSNSGLKLSSHLDFPDINSDNTINKPRLSNSPPSEGLSRKKQSKIDDFLKRTKDLNLSFNSSNTDFEGDCSKTRTISQESCDKKDLDQVTPTLEDNDNVVSKRQLRKETQPANGMYQENPEFLEYLELRQDQLMDEHPELTLEEIATYLYNTWFFEESLKSENKRTDNLEQRSLVKGLSQDIVGVKNIRKKSGVDKEKDLTKKIELPAKEKSKRRSERQFYREDFSDFEDELDIYPIFKSTSEREIKDEQVNSKNNINTNKEVLPADLCCNDNIAVEEDMTDNFDQVEEYFRKLTEAKPNLFKGLVREKLCEVCERAGDLIKCKGCHNFFHANCSRKAVEIKESPNPVRGRKKKRKNRGRKPKCLDDSFEDHSDKSQEHDMSFEHEIESHTIGNAVEFEEKLSEKLREMVENPDLKYDTNSSEEELDWSDTEIGACKIVEIIPKKKKQESIDFKCTDCEENSIPICFVCKRAVSAKKQIAHRQKCQVAHCYKYYHIECLEHWPQTQITTGEKKSKEFVESLQCPRHVCHTCVCDDPRGCKTRFSGDKLARCVRCPATYHTFTKCLPAGTQILSGSHIICPRHYEHRPGKVPCHVNTGWCFICALGGTLICCEYCPTSFHAECLNIEPPEGGYMCEDCETGCLPLYGGMVWVKLGHYRWWPGLILHPSEIPENILAVKHAPGEFVVRFFGQYDHYWVNRGRVFPFQEGDTGRVSSRNSKIDAAFSMAVEHAHRAYAILKNESASNDGDDDIASSLLPPHYVKLKVNKPCGSLINKKIDIEESSLTQCECNPNVEEPCGLYSHCLNRMLLTECGPICRAGERCFNRAFEKRQYPRMEPNRTSARGWGLRTLEDIRAGQFVIEYVGELIDETEFQRRMKWKHQVRDENYYFLTLDKERMIDAGPKGNLARFMNHSCDPNCETQKWTVLGDVRVGLFALYDIPAKSELTFNYNLECAGIEKKRCLCGTARCSGFMGAKPKEEPKKNKVKRAYKKRKRIELSPTNEQPKPKRRQPKNRELTEIEKDLLIIKNATNGISSDSESSGRHTSIDSVRRKRSENCSPSTKKVKIDKKKIDKLDQTLVTSQSKWTDVNHKSFDVD